MTEARRKSCLVVDDDEQFVRSLKRHLGGDELELDAAASVPGALAAFARGMPDAVLLDVRLGDADGLEQIPAIRAAGFAGHLIVLSADASFATAHRAAIAGADGYLVKGDFGAIQALLSCLLQRSSAGGAAPEPMPEAAIAYLASRGLNALELGLALQLAYGGVSDPEIAARTGRDEREVHDGFASIRAKLAAGTQCDLARMLGVLSCFGGGR